MENYFGLLGKDLKKLWQGLDSLQKTMILVLTLAAIAAVSYLLLKSTEPEWGVLYSDLSENDIAAVIETIKSSGSRYKIDKDNKTVLVPERNKEDLRLKIAEEDVIRDSNPGFELLNKMQFGATDFQNKLTRQKIFQDELTRTIQRIQGIKRARVQIAEPDRSVFSDKDDAPTASVMLILDSGIRLKNDQIKAIKNLVAYGIPRLTPEKVFVTDQTGMALGDDSIKGNSGLGDYRSEYENETSAKVQKVLQKIVGMGNVTVEVSAVINFDKTKTTIEQYLPAPGAESVPAGVVASTKEELETYDKGKKNSASTESSTESPSEASSEGSQQTEESSSSEKTKGTNYQKSKTSRDYKISKETKQVVYATGKIERLTVAVALNRILTSKEKEEIKNLVISASGADLSRGDIITVSGMQFAPEDPDGPEPFLDKIRNSSSFEFVFNQVAPLVVALILGIGVLYVLSSILKRPLQGELYDSGGGSRYLPDSDDEVSENRSMLETSSPMPAIEAKLDPELEKMRNELKNTILNDPSEAARLLLSYIKD